MIDVLYFMLKVLNIGFFGCMIHYRAFWTRNMKFEKYSTCRVPSNPVTNDRTYSELYYLGIELYWVS